MKKITFSYVVGLRLHVRRSSIFKVVYVFLYFGHLIHKLKGLEIIGLLLTTARSMRVTFRHLKGCHLEGRFGVYAVSENC